MGSREWSFAPSRFFFDYEEDNIFLVDDVHGYGRAC